MPRGACIYSAALNDLGFTTSSVISFSVLSSPYFSFYVYEVGFIVAVSHATLLGVGALHDELLGRKSRGFKQTYFVSEKYNPY